MNDSILVALITLAGVIVTAVVQSKSLSSSIAEQSKLADAEMDKKISVYAASTDAKIDTLTKSVQEHNQFAKRVPVLELRMDNVEKTIESLRGK